MKGKVKGKTSGVEKCKFRSDCGRMKYSGIDMAFIHVRGKRMLTMSEVARKLYPEWPRTTLTSRMKQTNIRRHLCTPREMQKVYSLNGIRKQGINCRLISKEDLDVFCNVYQVNDSVKQMGGDATAEAGKKQTPKRRGQQNADYPKPKVASFASDKLQKNASKVNKQSQNGKNNARAFGTKAARVSYYKRHVAIGINKAGSKQQHVVKTDRACGINGQLPSSSLTITDKIRKRCGVKETANVSFNLSRTATTASKKRRDTNSPASDCTSFDSGISSLALDAPLGLTKAACKNKRGVMSTIAKPLTKIKVKTKDAKMKYNKEQAIKGLKRKSGKAKNDRKSKKEAGVKKSKMVHCNKTESETITKEFVMKMNLKHMNDKDLINSFAQASTPLSTAKKAPSTKDTPYLVKLMPVKPVWRVNSSFRFISNFLLPPSLMVKDGELKPACSMVCKPGLRPPVAHPIWKWKIGGPVVGNKTEISYRVKKVKCVDSPTKQKQ